MSAAPTRSGSRSGTPLGTRSQSLASSISSSSSSSRKKSDQSDGGRPAASNYFSYPVSRVVSGLYRRITDPPQQSRNGNGNRHNDMTSSYSASLYTPMRTASPFQPPPLSALTLSSSATAAGYQHILTRALAEEIRLLVPPRLQLIDTWNLAYSLERDGSSLGTLYDACRQVSERSPRAGYVLVVRDNSDGGAVFGAYLTDPPHPSPHFYGTGECFLWRASVLSSTPLLLDHHHEQTGNKGAETDAEGGFHTMTDDELRRAGFPPPPSADTTNAVRSTTLRASTPTPDRQADKPLNNNNNSNTDLLALPGDSARGSRSGTSTPERIRFKAFPYSGVNDYMMFCETGFLSVGGGDGHYGLWIDDSVEKGVSASCPTFGNEPLSDEGTKFDILGVEVWYVGSS
ncbi:Oxidation resistance protein 1 [Talaromyces islandicus]|uniref:Oxidation resistance protein 1 n=1 Tax=Talaromyces islandicus TaxID=28573 RepID=A0A0U1LXW9_TALIS|nr:Oxidation resistance protein 1 [Talaromyces islandicus]